MPISKQKKKEIVEKTDEILKKSQSLVFVNFKGLKVNEANIMRKELKKNDVGFGIIKKTLLRRALSNSKTTGELPELLGEVAVAYGEDLVAPAREIFSFQRKFKDILSIVGGIFGGRYMSKEEMLGIATIPPLQVLHGQFVNLINSPIQGLVLALNEIAKKK
ncbi:MAG: 50S ribosomal protein L10 [Patescibacteria group bacterium]